MECLHWYIYRCSNRFLALAGKCDRSYDFLLINNYSRCIPVTQCYCMDHQELEKTSWFVSTSNRNHPNRKYLHIYLLLWTTLVSADLNVNNHIAHHPSVHIYLLFSTINDFVLHIILSGYCKWRYSASGQIQALLLRRHR